MALERTFKTITRSTLNLLAAGESERVDYKESPSGLSMDDLVAFANSASGGTILVGVAEKRSVAGAQEGAVRGCDIGDQTVLSILNKALECIPPVRIKISAENVAKSPFIRIDIPKSGSRPHSTRRGVYCIREGSRNRPLMPEELLSLFLEKEVEVFGSRFSTVAERLDDRLATVEKQISRRIEDLSGLLTLSDMSISDAESTLGVLISEVRALRPDIQDMDLRVRVLVESIDCADPVKKKYRDELLDSILQQAENDAGVRDAVISQDEITINLARKAASELNEDDLRQVFREARSILQKNARE